MSMSMHVLAVKPADENYKRKAEAYRACEAAGIPIPEELEKFFNCEAPDPTGVTQPSRRSSPVGSALQGRHGAGFRGRHRQASRGHAVRAVLLFVVTMPETEERERFAAEVAAQSNPVEANP